MSAVALIKFEQNSVVGADGQAYLGEEDEQVTVLNSDNTDVASWAIYLVYVPPTSALTVGLLAQGFFPNPPIAYFTPDVPGGCYRCKLIVQDGTGTTDVDIRNFGIFNAIDIVVPPYQRTPDQLPLYLKPDELNFGGQEFGWVGGIGDGMMWDIIAKISATIGEPITITMANIGTGQDAGLTMINETDAILNQTQYSPSIVLTGSGWDIDDAVAKEVNWLIQAEPIQGNTVTSQLNFYERVEGGAYVLRMSIGETSSATDTVATVADLLLLDDTVLDDGDNIGVKSLFDHYTLEKSSTEIADGFLITLTKSGIGRWHRACLPHDHWRQQLFYYINNATGNDESDGSSGSPLKTWAEFSRRHGGRLSDSQTPISKNVYLRGITFSEDIRIGYQMSWGDSLIVTGEQQVLFSGTITGFQGWDSSLRHLVEITDSGIPTSWTVSGLVGHLLIVTSGAAAGASCWVVEDIGTKTCRCGPFYSGPGGIPLEPAPGDAFQVVSFTRLDGNVSMHTGFGSVSFRDLYHVEPYMEFDVSDTLLGFCRCKITDSYLELVDITISLLGSYLFGTSAITTKKPLVAFENSVISTVLGMDFGILTLSYRNWVSGGAIIIRRGNWYLTDNSETAFTGFSPVFSYQHPIIVEYNSVLNLADNTKCWGSVTTATHALKIGPGSSMLISGTGNSFDITGSSVNDALVGGYSCTFSEALLGIRDLSTNAGTYAE